MKIYLGKQTPEHKGDTSRELVDMWHESGYCEVVKGEIDDYFIWANEPDDVLLYEYDRFDVFPGLPSKWERGLFGGMQSDDSRAVPWIYWGRRPRLLEAKINEGLKGYEGRNIESVFLGKIENPVQRSNRTNDNWFGVIEKFSLPERMGDSFKWPYSQREYLDIIAESRFGLCLAGYGPKCNREIEYFGLGVVPIFAPEVCDKYYESLIEGAHYFRITCADEIPDIIKGCSPSKWKEMSEEGKKWHERNCSRRGSYLVTEKIVENG